MRLTWLLLVSGCATPSWFELGVEGGPTAVGARLYAGASSGNCRAGERAADCTFDTVITTSFALDRADVFERAPASDVAIDLLAIGEGTTLMTVVADNGHETRTFTRYITALPVDSVAITPTVHDAVCAVPMRFAIGMRASLPIALRNGETVLHGHAFVPFEVAGATVDPARTTDERLEMQFPDTPGNVSITSRFDPSFSLALETFAPAQIESIVLGDGPANWFPLSPALISIDLLVVGQPVCGDSLSRTITSETPAICLIHDDDGDSITRTFAGVAAVRIRPYKSGTCTVHVDLAGTAVTATKSFTVITM